MHGKHAEPRLEDVSRQVGTAEKATNIGFLWFAYNLFETKALP